MERLESYLQDLCLIPGLAGFEQKVNRYMTEHFEKNGFAVQTDTLGNCMAKKEGTDPDAPVIMIFAHMDSLGFIVRYIEEDGFIRVERLGGIPEKALPATQVQVGTRDGAWLDGVIGMKAHHVTPPEEKYVVDKYTKLFVDIGASSREEVLDLGIDVGSPIIYKPKYQKLLGSRVLGSFFDNRSGCATLLALSDMLKEREVPSTVWLAGTVLEEYNLRGAMVASRTIRPDIAIGIDGGNAADTPDLQGQTLSCLGKGPILTHYNFHGRGTLNGTIAHPAMVRLMEECARHAGVSFQRRALLGGLTDLSYVQLEGTGIKSIDLGAPRRYSHGPCEVMDLNDIQQLVLWLEDFLTRNLKDYDFSR
ncbi:MAG: M20/M25/M40 family metallo-hydrolase [Dysosmobacter sp.]|nr:M20/M25/M40 family metallo-hydrolase [Dysosmobacter sp.]